MPKQLVIMRHANAPSGRDDHARALDGVGRQEARAVAQALDQHGSVPTRWLASDATRVRQTLESAAEELGVSLVDADRDDGAQRGEEAWVVDWQHGLYHAERETLLEYLWGLPSEAGVGEKKPAGLAGHNPGLSELVSWLTGIQTQLPTGGTVLLEGPDAEQGVELVEQSWAVAAKPGRWRMVEFWRPAALRASESTE